MYVSHPCVFLEMPVVFIQISPVQDQDYRDFAFYAISVFVLSLLRGPVLGDNEDQSIRIFYNCSNFLSQSAHCIDTVIHDY